MVTSIATSPLVAHATAPSQSSKENPAPVPAPTASTKSNPTSTTTTSMGDTGVVVATAGCNDPGSTRVVLSFETGNVVDLRAVRRDEIRKAKRRRAPPSTTNAPQSTTTSTPTATGGNAQTNSSTTASSGATTTPTSIAANNNTNNSTTSGASANAVLIDDRTGMTGFESVVAGLERRYGGGMARCDEEDEDEEDVEMCDASIQDMCDASIQDMSSQPEDTDAVGESQDDGSGAAGDARSNIPQQARTSSLSASNRRKRLKMTNAKLSKEEKEWVEDGVGFLDDTEAFQLEKQDKHNSKVTTVLSGFYVNRGPIETVANENAGVDDDGSSADGDFGDDLKDHGERSGASAGDEEKGKKRKKKMEKEKPKQIKKKVPQQEKNKASSKDSKDKVVNKPKKKMSKDGENSAAATALAIKAKEVGKAAALARVAAVVTQINANDALGTNSSSSNSTSSAGKQAVAPTSVTNAADVKTNKTAPTTSKLSPTAEAVAAVEVAKKTSKSDEMVFETPSLAGLSTKKSTPKQVKKKASVSSTTAADKAVLKNTKAKSAAAPSSKTRSPAGRGGKASATVKKDSKCVDKDSKASAEDSKDAAKEGSKDSKAAGGAAAAGGASSGAPVNLKTISRKRMLARFGSDEYVPKETKAKVYLDKLKDLVAEQKAKEERWNANVKEEDEGDDSNSLDAAIAASKKVERRDVFSSNRIPIHIDEALMTLDLKIRSWPTNSPTDDNYRYLAALITIFPFNVQWMTLHLKRLRAKHFLGRSEKDYQNALTLVRTAIHEQCGKPGGLKLTYPKRYHFPTAEMVVEAKAQLLSLLAALLECNTLATTAGGKGREMVEARDDAVEVLKKLLGLVKSITAYKKEPGATGTSPPTKPTDSGTEEAIEEKEKAVVPRAQAQVEAATAAAGNTLDDPLLLELQNTAELLSDNKEHITSGGVVLDSFREMIGASKRVLAKWKEVSGLGTDKVVSAAVVSLLSACVMCARGATMFEQQIQQDKEEAEIEQENRENDKILGESVEVVLALPDEPGVARALVWDVNSKEMVGKAEKTFNILFQSQMKYLKFVVSYETLSLGSTDKSLPNEKDSKVKMANTMMGLAPRGVRISRQSMSRVITSVHQRDSKAKAKAAGSSTDVATPAEGADKKDGDGKAKAKRTKKVGVVKKKGVSSTSTATASPASDTSDFISESKTNIVANTTSRKRSTSSGGGGDASAKMKKKGKATAGTDAKNKTKATLKKKVTKPVKKNKSKAVIEDITALTGIAVLGSEEKHAFPSAPVRGSSFDKPVFNEDDFPLFDDSSEGGGD